MSNASRNSVGEFSMTPEALFTFRVAAFLPLTLPVTGLPARSVLPPALLTLVAGWRAMALALAVFCIVRRRNAISSALPLLPGDGCGLERWACSLIRLTRSD